MKEKDIGTLAVDFVGTANYRDLSLGSLLGTFGSLIVNFLCTTSFSQHTYNPESRTLNSSLCSTLGFTETK